MDKDQQKANENLKEFIRYSSSPWRIVWTNFVAGVFRGLGAIIGASVFIALILWLLTLFVDIPLIGEYAANVKTSVVGYVNETNYNDEFERMSIILENIEKELAKEKPE
ncbi:MAG: hypothetical protein ACI88H_003899 [Cocleimonas sp.]|jgi:hypothetical protein